MHIGCIGFEWCHDDKKGNRKMQNSLHAYIIYAYIIGY